MPNDPLDFLDSSRDQTESSSDPLAFLESHKRSALEKGVRVGAQYGKGVLDVLSTPAMILGAISETPVAARGGYLGNTQRRIKELKDIKEKKGLLTSEQSAKLKALEELQAKGGYRAPSLMPSRLIEKASEGLGYDLKPEGMVEHGAEILGNIRDPKQLFKMAKNAPEFVKSLASKEARAAYKEAKNWERLSVITNGSPEKEALVQFAKQSNLSPEATTLLLQSEGKVENLGRLAKGKKFKAAIEELHEKLGNNYDKLKFFGRTGGHLPASENNLLADDLTNILGEMKKTHIVGPDAKPVLKTVEDAIDSVKKGGTVEELINSRQGIGQGINWKNVDQGDIFRQQIRDAFTRSIERNNPAIGARLSETDKAWSKYLKYQDLLDKRLPFIKVKGVEIPKTWLTGMAFLSPLLPIPFVGKAAAGIALAKEGLQKLSKEMLMNPKFQAPFKRLRNAIVNGDTSAQKAAFSIIRDISKKESPDIYENIKDIELD